MKTHISVAVILGLSACGGYEQNEAAYNNNDSAAYAENQANYSANAAGGNYAGGTATAGAAWPEGARIVVDDGVTYRIDPGGARVALGPNDSRIVVENGIRYRVDPSGPRVRISEEGVEVDVDPPAVVVNTQ